MDRPEFVLLIATMTGLVVRVDASERSPRLVAGDGEALVCSFCRRGNRDVIFRVDTRASRMCLACAKTCLMVAREEPLRALSAMVLSGADLAAFDSHKRSVQELVASLPETSRASTPVHAPSATSPSECGFCGIGSTSTSQLYAGLADYICGACLEGSVRRFIQVRDGVET